MAEKRNVRSYKIADAVYFKAQKRAAKEKTPLTQFIETIVSCYGRGEEIIINKKEDKK